MKQVRFSPQREIIYNYMLNTKAHPSAETIYNDLKLENPDLSFATVYRNLKLLEELGKVKRVYVGDNVERYDAMTSDHIHFVCDKCGSVIDLPDFDQKVFKEKFGSSVNGDIEWVNVILGGTCQKCRENK